jgi:ornithine cyclodeaminase/alanine dehydrogenase-like protein (mu-crystallin family)
MSGGLEGGNVSALDVLERFTDALGALCDLDPGSVSDGDTLVALSRSVDRLEAVVTRATARFDAERGYEADGARSCGDWVATSCHLPLGASRRRVKLARALRHMPVTERAWINGEICGAHVAMIDSARTPATAEVFARDEKILVDNARELRFGAFTKTLAYWGQLADPVGVENQARAQHDSRRVHHSKPSTAVGVSTGCSMP